MKKREKKKMERRSTSVEFEEWLRPIIDHMIAIYGLKPAVSAGIYLLANLPAEEQIKTVAFVKQLPKEYFAIVDEFLSALDAAKKKHNQGLKDANS